jgi:dCTP diphosphatase
MIYQKKCLPCEGIGKRLEETEIIKQLKKCSNWQLVKKELSPEKLRREFIFDTFMESISFVNRVSIIAENEQHHPVMKIFYKKVKIELYTHAVEGLTSNDFIMAHIIDSLAENDSTYTMDDLTTLALMKQRAYTFVRERDWEQFHTLKNLSMSIAVEAAELMELFLWKNTQEEENNELAVHKKKISYELSDIMLGILTFANKAEIDISSTFFEKMPLIEKRYSIETSKGKSIKKPEKQ